MNTEYYLFDFDGTLVDSMEIWAGNHISALQRGGIPVPENFVETITPLGNYKASQYTISLGLNISLEDYLDKVTQDSIVAYSTLVNLKPNVAETLKRLKQRGVSVNVFTASPHIYVDDCLKRWGVYDYFEKVWSIEDFGTMTKGETRIYETAAQRLETEIGNCTLIDDNYIAIATAKEAGMKTIAIFDKSSRSQESALRALADQYIYDFNEII